MPHSCACEVIAMLRCMRLKSMVVSDRAPLQACPCRPQPRSHSVPHIPWKPVRPRPQPARPQPARQPCSYSVPHIPWKRLAEGEADPGRDWAGLVRRLLALCYAVDDLTLPVLSKPQASGGRAARGGAAPRGMFLMHWIGLLFVRVQLADAAGASTPQPCPRLCGWRIGRGGAERRGRWGRRVCNACCDRSMI